MSLHGLPETDVALDDGGLRAGMNAHGVTFNALSKKSNTAAITAKRIATGPTTAQRDSSKWDSMLIQSIYDRLYRDPDAANMRFSNKTRGIYMGANFNDVENRIGLARDHAIHMINAGSLTLASAAAMANTRGFNFFADNNDELPHDKAVA